MIKSASEFVRLVESDKPADRHRAAWDSAPTQVWRDIIENYPDMRFWVAGGTGCGRIGTDEWSTEGQRRVIDTAMIVSAYRYLGGLRAVVSAPLEEGFPVGSRLESVVYQLIWDFEPQQCRDDVDVVSMLVGLAFDDGSRVTFRWLMQEYLESLAVGERTAGEPTPDTYDYDASSRWAGQVDRGSTRLSGLHTPRPAATLAGHAGSGSTTTRAQWSPWASALMGN